MLHENLTSLHENGYDIHVHGDHGILETWLVEEDLIFVYSVQGDAVTHVFEKIQKACHISVCVGCNLTKTWISIVPRWPQSVSTPGSECEERCALKKERDGEEKEINEKRKDNKETERKHTQIPREQSAATPRSILPD